MPTKAGRVRIEDLRVGRVIWDIGVDWGERGAYARPLVIVHVERRHFGHNTDIHFSTREPLEKIRHFFHARSKLTRCGFWGSHDAQWSDQEVVDWGLDPINFFVNRKAAERYLTRLRQQAEFRRSKFIPQRESVPHIPKGTGQRDRLNLPYQPLATYDPTDVQPKTPQDIVDDFRSCFRADLDTRDETLITSIRAGLIAPAAEMISQEQLVESIRAYIAKVKDEPPADFKVENIKAQPDGSVEFSISGPPEVIQALQHAGAQPVSMSIQGSISDAETTPYAKYRKNYANPTFSFPFDPGFAPLPVPLEDANKMFKHSSDSLRMASGAELRDVKVTPLPADPKDLAQGYSWPVRVEGIQPAAEATGSTSDEASEAGERTVGDGEADPDRAV
jgi:hypothetical protein